MNDGGKAVPFKPWTIKPLTRDELTAMGFKPPGFTKARTPAAHATCEGEGSIADQFDPYADVQPDAVVNELTGEGVGVTSSGVINVNPAWVPGAADFRGDRFGAVIRSPQPAAVRVTARVDVHGREAGHVTGYVEFRATATRTGAWAVFGYGVGEAGVRAVLGLSPEEAAAPYAESIARLVDGALRYREPTP